MDASDDRFERAQSGDDQAVDELVQLHLSLVRHVVRRFESTGWEKDDLFQVGCMGLVKAIKSFRADLGNRFSTYAVPVIIGEIRNWLRSQGLVKVGREARQLAHNARQAEAEWYKRHGRSPSVHELAAHLGITPEFLIQALEATRTPASLHEPQFDPEDDDILMDRIPDPDSDLFHKKIDSLVLEEALQHLDARLREIILLRFFDEKTQQEVAERLNISQVQVSRLEKKALLLLRKFIA